MERTPHPEGLPQRSTLADRRDYTVAELRGIVAKHGLPAPLRLTHDELVELITSADIPLPPKRAQRRRAS